jgi:hypothetical protein
MPAYNVVNYLKQIMDKLITHNIGTWAKYYTIDE